EQHLPRRPLRGPVRQDGRRVEVQAARVHSVTSEPAGVEVMRLLASLALMLVASSAHAQTPCEQLTSVKVFDAVIFHAETVAAGAFGATPPDPTFKTLPAFCRVEGFVNRSNDTGVKFELWMPPQTWHGAFRPAASGLGGGAITSAGMGPNM